MERGQYAGKGIDALPKEPRRGKEDGICRAHLLRLSCYSALQDNGYKSSRIWGILTGDTQGS